MEKLERSEWLKYQEILPVDFSLHHKRIIDILEGKEVKEKYKNMTLNDILRNTWIWWDIVITHTINSLQESVKNSVIEKIRLFDDFNEENDPYWEHDFWKVSLEDENYFFKVDYFSKEPWRKSDYLYGSEEPSNPSITSRVLTIMHAQEY